MQSKAATSYSAKTGSLASMVKPVVVYWVQYVKSGEAYDVITAYSHRIKWRV